MSSNSPKLVYGTANPGADPNTHIRPDDAPAPTQTYSMTEYLTTGAGRYALPSDVPLIQAFFGDASKSTPTLPDGKYTANQIRSILVLNQEEGRLVFNIDNCTTDAFSDDFIGRSYVFGRSGFVVEEDMEFEVIGGYLINNLTLNARSDDFDFWSESPIAWFANIALEDYSGYVS